MPTVVLAFGLGFGIILVFLFSRLTATYATFCAASILFPLAALTLKKSKELLMIFLGILLPVTVDITIGHQPDHLGGAAGYMVSFFDVCLGALYFLWVVEIIKGRSSIRFFGVVTVPSGILIAVAGLSMLKARYPEYSTYELLEIGKMYLAFLYLSNNIRSRSHVELLVTVLIAGLLFEGVLGIAQRRYGEPFFPTSLGGPSWVADRIKGTWLSFNDFSWYLTFVLPLAISMMASPIRVRYKMICFLAVIAGSGSLIWTNSRAGWISLAVSGVFVGVFVFRKIRSREGLIRILLLTITIAVLIIPLYPKLYNKIYYRFVADDGGSGESRIPHMQVAWEIIEANPVLGVGVNNYTEVMYAYDNTEEGLGEYSRFPVHNIFLHLAAEIGTVGLCCFIWLIMAVFMVGVKTVVFGEDLMSYVGLGLLGGILAFLVHGLADTASLGSKLFVFVWFFSGMLLGIRRIQMEESEKG